MRHGTAELTLLGTAHVSQASADKVKELLTSGLYDIVALELCDGRHRAISQPEQLAEMDLFEVLRSGKTAMVTASLVLSAFQQRIADQMGVEPGMEMRTAIAEARRLRLPVELIDREIGITLKRTYRSLPWWKRLTLFSGLVAAVFSRETVDSNDIEKLKQGDILQTAFSEFAAESPELMTSLIDERDRYMAARLRLVMERHPGRHILAVVGAGHLPGIATYFNQATVSPRDELSRLEQLPPPGRLSGWIAWTVIVLIVSGFIIGFMRSPELGLDLMLDWVLINGGLAAMGAALAMAHPLTLLGAFLAAPVTSLNPTINAGMVTAGIELLLRKPHVRDFASLRRDTTHLTGWWKNRAARILLIFLFSAFGSALGTYFAGFSIYSQLA